MSPTGQLSDISVIVLPRAYSVSSLTWLSSSCLTTEVIPHEGAPLSLRRFSLTIVAFTSSTAFGIGGSSFFAECVGVLIFCSIGKTGASVLTSDIPFAKGDIAILEAELLSELRSSRSAGVKWHGTCFPADSLVVTSSLIDEKSSVCCSFCFALDLIFFFVFPLLSLLAAALLLVVIGLRLLGVFLCSPRVLTEYVC